MVDAKVLKILSMAGRYNKWVRERVCPLIWAQGGHASFDIYMITNQHLIKEKHETISGA